MIAQVSSSSYKIYTKRGKRPQDKEQWKKEKEQSEDLKKTQSGKSSRTSEEANNSKTRQH